MDPIKAFIEANLRPGQVGFDVGANRGVYAKIMAGCGARVVAFEPDADSAATLREACAGLPVEIVEAAVSDEIGSIEFYRDLRPGLQGLASSVNRLRGMEDKTEKVVVPRLTLDGFCAERGIAPNLIKIDVEGHESAVIRGASGIIADCRPFILFEFWESWWHRGIEEIFDHLYRDYELKIAQTGELAYQYYKERSDLAASNVTVDITCTPRGDRPSSNPRKPGDNADNPIST